MIERERKYRLDDATAARLRRQLDGLAGPGRTELQDTVHYTDPSGRLARLNLRLRTTDDRRELTVKGPRVGAGPSKVREEHTIAFSGDVEHVLEALGLVADVRYRKETRIYAVQATKVSLDEVNGLGLFCEIEAPDEAAIERVAMMLGLGEESHEPRGYARLVRSAGTDRPDDEVQ